MRFKRRWRARPCRPAAISNLAAFNSRSSGGVRYELQAQSKKKHECAEEQAQPEPPRTHRAFLESGKSVSHDRSVLVGADHFAAVDRRKCLPDAGSYPAGIVHFAPFAVTRVIDIEFHELIEFLMKCTEPSANPTLTPPGW